MSNKIDLEKALNFANKQNENSLQWIKELNDKNDFLAKYLPTTHLPREKDILRRIISAYISIIIEHHKSIIELTNVRQSSALCLVRPIYEAYIRVSWLSLFENSDKIIKPIKKICELKDNDAFPTLEKMCKELDEELSKIQKINNTEIMLRHFNNNKKLMHSYTHGGGYLLSIQMNKKDIFTHQDMIDVLDSVTQYLLNSMSAFAQVEKNINIILRISQQTEKVSNIEIATTSKNYQNRVEHVRMGIFTHEILSQIKTKKDVTKVLNSYLLEGKITNEEKTSILERIKSVLNNDKYSNYFEENLKIINEREMFATENEQTKTYRPDRLVETKDGFIIIDFKTGEEKEKDQKQVETYKNKLEQFGKKVVKTDVIYI